MVDTGTYADDTKLNGKTRNERPWAACGLPAANPMAINNHTNANPYRIVSPSAPTLSTTDPAERNPTANPTAVMTTTPHATTDVSASTRPVTIDSRRIGRLRSRSKRPPSRSSATPLAAVIPWNSTPVTTNP